MPLCTVADVKLAARIDPDLTEWDAEIPGLIASATEQIEQCCNVPPNWFDQSPAPRGTAAARRACIALAALQLDDPGHDPAKILAGPMLWPAIWYGDMPTIPADAAPIGALLIGGGYLTLPAGSLAITT